MAGKPGMRHKSPPSPAHADALRERIKADKIVDRLNNHALGQIEMTKSQVSAGLGLLRKVVPDMLSTAVSGTLNIGDILQERLASGRQRADR